MGYHFRKRPFQFRKMVRFLLFFFVTIVSWRDSLLVNARARCRGRRARRGSLKRTMSGWIPCLKLLYRAHADLHVLPFPAWESTVEVTRVRLGSKSDGSRHWNKCWNHTFGHTYVGTLSNVVTCAVYSSRNKPGQDTGKALLKSLESIYILAVGLHTGIDWWGFPTKLNCRLPFFKYRLYVPRLCFALCLGRVANG